MSGFTSTVQIDGDPETVFAVMTNLENAPLWVMGIVGADPLGRGPMRAGFKYRETRHIGAKESTRLFEILEHEPPAEGKSAPFTHVAQSIQMGFKTTYYYLAESNDHGGSRLEMTVVIEATNPFSRIFLPLVFRDLKKQDGDQLVRLKEFIESMPPPAETDPEQEPSSALPDQVNEEGRETEAVDRREWGTGDLEPSEETAGSSNRVASMETDHAFAPAGGVEEMLEPAGDTSEEVSEIPVEPESPRQN